MFFYFCVCVQEILILWRTCSAQQASEGAAEETQWVPSSFAGQPNDLLYPSGPIPPHPSRVHLLKHTGVCKHPIHHGVQYSLVSHNKTQDINPILFSLFLPSSPHSSVSVFPLSGGSAPEGVICAAETIGRVGKQPATAAGRAGWSSGQRQRETLKPTGRASRPFLTTTCVTVHHVPKTEHTVTFWAVFF